MLQSFVFMVVLLSTRGVCMGRSFCHGNGKRQIHLCVWTYFNDTGQQIPVELNAILGNHNETSRSSTVEDASAGLFARVPAATTTTATTTADHRHPHVPSRSTNSSVAYAADETSLGSANTSWSSSEIPRWTSAIRTDHTAKDRVQSGIGRTGQKNIFNKRWCGGFIKFTNCLVEAVGHCPASHGSACGTVASFRAVYGRTICKIDIEAWKNKYPLSCKIADGRNRQAKVQEHCGLLTLAFLDIWWIVFFSESSLV